MKVWFEYFWIIMFVNAVIGLSMSINKNELTFFTGCHLCFIFIISFRYAEKFSKIKE